MVATVPQHLVNNVIAGDCVQVLSRLPAECIDLTITSPPYDDLRSYKGRSTNNRVDLRALGASLLRATRHNGVACMVLNDQTVDAHKTLTTFRTAVAWVDLGWQLFECCIYHRHGKPGGWWNKRFRVDHEYILIFFKGDKPAVFHKEPLMVASKNVGRVWQGSTRKNDDNLRPVEPVVVQPLKCRGTIWSYLSPAHDSNRLKQKHPATFPDDLARDLILCFSDRAG